jgi:peptidoglycan/LPS O-acetylase OafA/YrhL
MQSTNRRYVPLLDVLRAAAAWWVVMYHTVIAFQPPAGAKNNMWLGTDNPVLLVLSQGWLAVSVFVMLSGYSLSLGLRKGEIMWGAYLRARWLRVAPLYLVVLVLGTLALGRTSPPTPGSFFTAVTMLPVPGAHEPGPWLDTAWSVKIELVLYLFIPALVYAARRYKPLPTIAMSAIIGSVVFLALQQTSNTLDILYSSLPGRMVEFAVGFFLGYAGHVLPARLRRAGLVVGVLGFVAVAVVANRSGGFRGLPPATRLALYVAVIVLGALLLLAVDHRPKASSSRLVAAASAVGSWSYSTYLWHMVVLHLFVVPRLFQDTSLLGDRGSLLAGMAFMVVAVLALSWASFNLIERPFLSLRPTYIRRDAEEQPAPAEASRASQLLARTLRTTARGVPVAVPVARRAASESVGAGGRS